LDTEHSLGSSRVDYFQFCIVFFSLVKGGSESSGGKSRGSSVSSGGKSRGSSVSSGSNSGGSGISEGSDGGDSRGSRDMGSGNSGSSSGISNMLNRPLDTDGFVGDSVDWGVDRCDDLLGRVGGVGSVVDVRGLDDLLDGVDLVGSSDGDSPWDSNLIGGGHVLVDDDLTGNRGWHMDGDINVVFLHIQLGNNVGGLGGDLDMGPHGGEDLLLGDGVSRSRSKVPGCRGDGSQRCWGSRDGWGSNGHGDLGVLGSSSHIGSSGLGDVLNSGNSVLVSSNNTLGSSLDDLVSDDSVLGVLLDGGSSGSVGLVGLSYDSGGGDHRGASVGASSSHHSGAGSSSNSSGKGSGNASVDSSFRGWGTHSDSHKGKESHKSVHLY